MYLNVDFEGHILNARLFGLISAFERLLKELSRDPHAVEGAKSVAFMADQNWQQIAALQRSFVDPYFGNLQKLWDSRVLGSWYQAFSGGSIGGSSVR